MFPSWTDPANLRRDLTAGVAVFFVALPLCLGVALASGAPLFSGILAGIVGGILVGALSGSHTSVSGPAAGLTAVVAIQITSLGSFSAFLLAVMVAGILQIGLGLLRAGFLAAFIPSSVIKGLLAAIGIILILKQIPHLVGHDPDPEGEMSFLQPDLENTFSEIVNTLDDFQPGSAAIGLLSLVILFGWDRSKRLKNFPVPSSVVVVLLGVVLNLAFTRMGQPWYIDPTHLVQVPTADSISGFLNFLQLPDFTRWLDPAIYRAAITIAAVASLETLLNLEAVDKLDPRQRTSPPSRELFAQGIGNVACGLIGGLPVTSVIVRSSVNINSGARTKFSTIFHGVLILTSVLFLAEWLNVIPLSCLAAILLVTGVKLASPKLVKQMWAGGWPQFGPFIVTVLAIVFTDLLVGVMIGLGVALAFILRSNVSRPLRQRTEHSLAGDVVRIELSNQVSFLNRAALTRGLDAIPPGGHVILDAENTHYIDPDILDLIRDFHEKTGPARGIRVSLRGFRSTYQFPDEASLPEEQARPADPAPSQVLQLLRDGHERFRNGRWQSRDLRRVVDPELGHPRPLVVIFGDVDSRAPADNLFDLGVGDVLSVRVAGHQLCPEVLGSLEYATRVAGAKLVLVLGHARGGVMTAVLDLIESGKTAIDTFGSVHLEGLAREVRQARVGIELAPDLTEFERAVARRHVERVVAAIHEQSQPLQELRAAGKLAIVGAVYDMSTGQVEFLAPPESA